MSEEYKENENIEQEHRCCCGGHGHSEEGGEHKCCGGNGHSDEDGEHKCCGGHGHSDEDGEHKCCGGHNEIPDLNEIPDVPFPDPTLSSLAESIATQALVSLGLIPNPMTGKAVVRRNQAKHLIDTVELIFNKTKGNQTEEESKFIEGILHELRMFYIRMPEQQN